MMNDYSVSIPTSVKVKKNTIKFFEWAFVALVILLLYLPVIFIMIESFNANKVTYGFSGFTLKWYTEMLHNRALHEAIQTTFSITILSTLISTILGTVFAIGINSLSASKRKPIILMNNIPILNADIVSAVFLFIVFKTIGGMLGIDRPFGYTTLLLAHIFFSVPYVVLSVLPKLKEIDENLFDAALDLGCTPRKALSDVILPAISGGIFSGAVLAFTMSIDDFTISYFVKGAEIINLSTWINTIRTARHGKLQIASAFYTIFTIVAFVGLLGYNIYVSKKQSKKKMRG